MSRSSIQSRHRLAMTLLLLVLGSISGVLAQEAEKPTPTGEKKDGKGKAKAEKTEKADKTAKSKDGNDAAATTTPGAAQAPALPTTGLHAFGKMLPVGQAHKVLEIPSFKNGAPASMVQARVMTRMDDENMFLERMDIWMYGPPGEAEKDMRVQLRTATYHMPSNIIASDERARISRSDFDLQGDTLIFDTATGQGKMVGNVKMILHDASSLTKTPEEKAADKEKEKTGQKNKSGKEEKEPGSTPAPDAASSSPTPSSPPPSPSAGGTPAAANTPAAATAVQQTRAGASPTNPKK